MFFDLVLALSRHPLVVGLGKWQAATPTSAIAAYVVFGALGLAIHHFVAGGAFSSIITMSSLVQCLGISLLCIKVVSSGSAEGISAGALILDAFAFAFRLSSTTWLNGYLPVDKSGDYAIQAIDMCSLALVLWLLRRVLVVHKHSYQASEDSFQIRSMVLVCLGLAAFLHADEDRKWLFDVLWMASLFLGVVAVLPQLWLITKSGGRVEALISHYVAALALSRVMSGTFMWAARRTINCSPWVGGFNHAVVAIFSAHILHLILLGDFMFYYIKSMMQNGLGEAMQTSLPQYI
jgi:hypothetical protein